MGHTETHQAYHHWDTNRVKWDELAKGLREEERTSGPGNPLGPGSPGGPLSP